MRSLVVGACIALFCICSVNPSLSDDRTAQTCKILSQYMVQYYELYQASRRKTNPQDVANLRTGVEHRLMDLGIQAEVAVALARYEFACRACFYLGWDSECDQIPHYAETVVKLSGCVE